MDDSNKGNRHASIPLQKKTGCLISNHSTQTNHLTRIKIMISNQLRNLEQELTLQTHALDYFSNK